MRQRFRNISSFNTQRLLALLFIVALAFAVRSLTANFLRAHFDDPGWFQFGSYSVFDRQAQNILDRKEPIFWINDSSRTDQMIYPPGYPLWMASIYALSGDRSPAAVQRVQLLLDSLSVLLLVGIGATAFGWGVGIAAGVLGALTPLLALAGATPNADAPTNWLMLGAVWLLLLAAKRKSIGRAGGGTRGGGNVRSRSAQEPLRASGGDDRDRTDDP
ncbi:MAG TPA: glycosyltransferase family 39 protein, partial [Pyrinomonadaceae bacterium]|nr:glycosyltransferase family 39 protein [Pyrinomonadaceae bacterium]